MLSSLRKTAVALALAALTAGTAAAGDLPAPTGKPILTIGGAIGNTNDGASAVFDLDMLKQLPASRVETQTIWTEGLQSFEGVALKDLMDAVEADGTSLRAVALNDYSVEIPMSDAAAGRALLAYSVDGKPMSVRDKGPLWIVYPYDANAEFRSEVIYTRSIWQLTELEVLP